MRPSALSPQYSVDYGAERPGEKTYGIESVEDDQEEFRNKELVKFVSGMLDPAGKVSEGCVAPPNGDYLATQLKSVTAYSNLGTGPVPISGAIVWLPQCGVDWLHRFSLWKEGQAVPTTNSFTPPSPPGVGQAFLGMAGVSATLARNVFVPVAPSEDIAITPHLELEFTKGRLIGGIVTVISDAQSTVRAAMSGTISAGALNDTRASPDFSAPSLKQQSRQNEGIVDCKIQTGVAAILGSDIPPTFEPLKFEDTYGRSSGAYVKDILNGLVLSGQYCSATSAYKFNNSYSAAFVSPFLRLAEIAGAGVGAPPYQPPLMEPLALPDSQAFIVHCYCDSELTTAEVCPSVSDKVRTVTAGLAFASIQVVHYYLYSSTSGAVPALHLIVQTERIEVQESASSMFWAGNYSSNTPQYAKASIPGFEPAVFEGADSGGTNVSLSTQFQYWRIPVVVQVAPKKPSNSLWVGTLFATSGDSGSSANAANVTTTPGCMNSIAWTIASPISAVQLSVAYSVITRIDFIANRIYAQGVLGPARIIRWDNCAQGQNILINGTLVTEIVPGGIIAPFYKNQQGGSGPQTTANLLGCAACLWNSNSGIYKRIYDGDQYKVILEKVIPQLNAYGLRNDVLQLGGRVGRQALEASGFFDTLSKVGQIAQNAAMNAAQQILPGMARDMKRDMKHLLPSTGKRKRKYRADGDFDDEHAEGDYEAHGEYEAQGQMGAGQDSDDESASGNYAFAQGMVGADADSDDENALGGYELNRMAPGLYLPASRIKSIALVDMVDGHTTAPFVLPDADARKYITHGASKKYEDIRKALQLPPGRLISPEDAYSLLRTTLEYRERKREDRGKWKDFLNTMRKIGAAFLPGMRTYYSKPPESGAERDDCRDVFLKFVQFLNSTRLDVPIVDATPPVANVLQTYKVVKENGNFLAQPLSFWAVYLEVVTTENKTILQPFIACGPVGVQKLRHPKSYGSPIAWMSFRDQNSFTQGVAPQVDLPEFWTSLLRYMDMGSFLERKNLKKAYGAVMREAKKKDPQGLLNYYKSLPMSSNRMPASGLSAYKSGNTGWVSAYVSGTGAEKRKAAYKHPTHIRPLTGGHGLEEPDNRRPRIEASLRSRPGLYHDGGAFHGLPEGDDAAAVGAH